MCGMFATAGIGEGKVTLESHKLPRLAERDSARREVEMYTCVLFPHANFAHSKNI